MDSPTQYQPPTDLDELIAGWLHGADCTCPHAVEPPDLERAADLIGTLGMNGWRLVDIRHLRAGLDAEVPAFLDVTMGSVLRDELAAAIFDGFPYQPPPVLGPLCEHGNRGWCGSCDALIERGVLG